MFYNICSKTRNHFSLEKYSAHLLRLCKYYSNEFENQLHMYMYLRFLAPKVFQISLRSWNIHIHVMNYFEDRITSLNTKLIFALIHTHTPTCVCNLRVISIVFLACLHFYVSCHVWSAVEVSTCVVTSVLKPEGISDFHLRSALNMHMYTCMWVSMQVFYCFYQPVIG